MYVFVPAACSSETEKAYAVSSVEHLQPFKDKMDGFLSQGRKLAANTHTYTHTDIHVHTGATIQFGFLRLCDWLTKPALLMAFEELC